MIQNPESIKQFESLAKTLKKSRKLFIVACGSSLLRSTLRKVCDRSFGRNTCGSGYGQWNFNIENPLIQPKDPILFISQSGETADTLSSFHLAQSKGALTIAFCNVENSSLDRSVDHSFHLKIRY